MQFVKLNLIVIVALIMTSAVRAGTLEVQQNNLIIDPNNLEIHGPVCGTIPNGARCFELLVGTPELEVLTIGPGARLCGPATVRLHKDGPAALEIGRGVCIPKIEGGD